MDSGREKPGKDEREREQKLEVYGGHIVGVCISRRCQSPRIGEAPGSL